MSLHPPPGPPPPPHPLEPPLNYLLASWVTRMPLLSPLCPTPTHLAPPFRHAAAVAYEQHEHAWQLVTHLATSCRYKLPVQVASSNLQYLLHS